MLQPTGRLRTLGDATQEAKKDLGIDIYYPWRVVPSAEAFPTPEQVEMMQIEVKKPITAFDTPRRPQQISGTTIGRFKMYPSLRVSPKERMLQRLNIIPSDHIPEAESPYPFPETPNVPTQLVTLESRNVQLSKGSIKIPKQISDLRVSLERIGSQVELPSFRESPVGLSMLAEEAVKPEATTRGVWGNLENILTSTTQFLLGQEQAKKEAAVEALKIQVAAGQAPTIVQRAESYLPYLAIGSLLLIGYLFIIKQK